MSWCGRAKHTGLRNLLWHKRSINSQVVWRIATGKALSWMFWSEILWKLQGLIWNCQISGPSQTTYYFKFSLSPNLLPDIEYKYLQLWQTICWCYWIWKHVKKISTLCKHKVIIIFSPLAKTNKNKNRKKPSTFAFYSTGPQIWLHIGINWGAGKILMPWSHSQRI